MLADCARIRPVKILRLSLAALLVVAVSAETDTSSTALFAAIQCALFVLIGNAILEVRDDGIGIPTDAIPHIFERFYQADPSRSDRSDGVGLGLSLVKWAVDQHGGSVEVESSPGHGSCFVVKMPQQSH